MAHLWARWLLNPCRLGDPLRFRAGAKSEVAHLWASGQGGYLTPCRPRGSPPLQSGGQNQKWPTCGQGGYLTPAASGVPSASERGAESEVAHLWARWLLNPCRLGGPPRFGAGGQNQKWPSGQGGYLTPTASGVPSASGRGPNQKWPTCGQGGYLTHLPPRGSPPLSFERGAESELAHLWARWLLNPCRLGGTLRFRAGGRIRSGPLVGRWLLNRYRLGDPLRFRAGGRIRSGPLVGKRNTCRLGV